MNQEQFEQVRAGRGFIAALDQSGGSTPKALALYGIGEDAFSNDEEMFTLMHEMRTRIMTSPAFTGERIVGAILFENTMDRQVEGKDTADYLWSVKHVVPFIKIDKGLEAEADGVQLMKPMPGLDDLLARSADKGMFGTKERSVVNVADDTGIKAIVDQQFEVGEQVLSHGLVPIIEPEVNINCGEKAKVEQHLRDHLVAKLDGLADDQHVMLKLTLPDVDGFYDDLVAHPNVLKVVALSGGYRRDVANAKLTANHGIIASFSRALTEGLSAQQGDEEFNGMLDRTIESIYLASLT
jgi:fructose-bisphosphate aldolase class I